MKKGMNLCFVFSALLVPMLAVAQCWDEISSVPGTQALLKVDFVNDQLGWAVRSTGLGSGAIIHTTNGGAGWSVQVSVPYRLENIDFVDANNGWAVGYYSIYRTTNGGTTWTRTVVDHAIMLGVSFVDANNGWVVGDDLAGGDSPIWHTTNGGASWIPQASGTLYGLNEVSFPDANHGCAVGLGGVTLNTTNGGATWVNQPSGTGYSLNGVSFMNENFGLAAGGHGTILVSFDGGASWTPGASGTTAALYDVSMCDMNGWVVGDSCLVLRTASAGFEWTREHEQLAMYPLLLGVVCYGERAWAVGYDLGSYNVVWRNVCPVPQHLVVQYTPERSWPYPVPPILALNWGPAAEYGTVNYNVYDDSLVNGSYEHLVGSTPDTTYLIWGGGNQPRRFYIVKTVEP